MAEEPTTPGTTEEPVTGTTTLEGVADGSADASADGSDRAATPTLEEVMAENERLKNNNQQLLSQKTTFEEASKRLAELESGNQRPPTPDPRQYQVEQALQRQQEIIARVQADAAAGDYYAQFALQNAQFMFNQLTELRDDVRTAKEPEAVASRARAIRNQRPHLTMDDALEFARKEAELEALKNSARPKPSVNPTDGAMGGPRPAAPITPQPSGMTSEQYESRLVALEAAGKWDERRKLVHQRVSGQLKVTTN